MRNHLTDRERFELSAPAELLPESYPSPRFYAEVCGWNADDEYVTWSESGDTEEEAISSAAARGGIIEVGDVNTMTWEAYEATLRIPQ